ncbi:MAG: hypothetical protein GKR86_15035 [Ilumatobacter sp.]|nr:hypothetical protein [Ilumatobacter sp.]
MEVRGKPPVLGIHVVMREAFIHCSKAVRRSALWDPDSFIDRDELPSLGQILRDQIELPDMSADDIAEMRKSMNADGPTVSDLTEAGIPAKAEDSKEVRDLQVKLFKAQKGSNAPARRETVTDEVAELAKSEEAEGLAIAALMNEQLGNAPDAGGMRVIG